MVIGGHPLGSNNGTVLSIDMNSPDMSADGWVGLTDVGLFAAALLEYDFCADLVNPGVEPLVIDLADVGRFANALDDGCP